MLKRHSLITVFPIVHGPCFSDKDCYFDLVRCLHCKSWVTPELQWMTRSNNYWSTYDVKQSIINHGVICMSICVKGSTKEDLEWGMSFSVGEKLLVYTFTHVQLLCYALMKILLKDVIEIALDCKDLLFVRISWKQSCFGYLRNCQRQYAYLKTWFLVLWDSVGDLFIVFSTQCVHITSLLTTICLRIKLMGKPRKFS